MTACLEKAYSLMREKFARGSFARDAAILMAGTFVGQGIAIAVSPILTRLYSPDDYGVYALFMSITSAVCQS